MKIFRSKRQEIMADYNTLKKHWTQACIKLETCADDDKRQELLEIKSKCEHGGKMAHETLRLMALDRRYHWAFGMAVALFVMSAGLMIYMICIIDFSDPDSLGRALKSGYTELGMLLLGTVCLHQAGVCRAKKREITK